MIKNRSEMRQTIEIDLGGPEGNAFVLIGYAKTLGKRLRMSHKDVDFIIHKMMRSNYENLVQVFDESFGHVVTLFREY